MINPEWEALQDKPHFVPLCCTPEYVKMLEKLVREHHLAVEAHAERPAWAKVNEEFFQEFVRKHAIAAEKLTEKQLAEAIRQAIACGDFIKYVHRENGGQQVVYIPFAEQARLQARIRELEGEVEILRDYDDHRDG